MEKKKKLRKGFTTGTCAAIAAKAATRMAVKDCIIENETILTPKGIEVTTEIEDIQKEKQLISWAIRKDAGNDPDVTNGILIYAQVELITEHQIIIDGGTGVGRVTKAGLSQKIGEAAINPVPKKMIEQEVRKVLEENHYPGGARVIISVPEGEKIAKKTLIQDLALLVAFPY